jgi:hypothetical protein
VDADAGAEFEAKRFDHEGWSVRIFLTGAGLNGFVAGHADLYQDEAHKCRIALASQQYDQAGAIVVLEERATTFIADWDGRDHTGDTGTAEL